MGKNIGFQNLCGNLRRSKQKVKFSFNTLHQNKSITSNDNITRTLLIGAG